MLLPEDRLERLVEQLKGLARADREGVMARLSADERSEIKTRLRGSAQRPWSPYSADIAARIEAGDQAPLTSAARSALHESVNQAIGGNAPSSLAEVLLHRLRQWARP